MIRPSKYGNPNKRGVDEIDVIYSRMRSKIARARKEQFMLKQEIKQLNQDLKIDYEMWKRQAPKNQKVLGMYKDKELVVNLRRKRVLATSQKPVDVSKLKSEAQLKKENEKFLAEIGDLETKKLIEKQITEGLAEISVDMMENDIAALMKIKKTMEMMEGQLSETNYSSDFTVDKFSRERKQFLTASERRKYSEKMSSRVQHCSKTNLKDSRKRVNRSQFDSGEEEKKSQSLTLDPKPIRRRRREKLRSRGRTKLGVLDRPQLRVVLNGKASPYKKHYQPIKQSRSFQNQKIKERMPYKGKMNKNLKNSIDELINQNVLKNYHRNNKQSVKLKSKNTINNSISKGYHSKESSHIGINDYKKPTGARNGKLRRKKTGLTEQSQTFDLRSSRKPKRRVNLEKVELPREKESEDGEKVNGSNSPVNAKKKNRLKKIQGHDSVLDSYRNMPFKTLASQRSGAGSKTRTSRPESQKIFKNKKLSKEVSLQRNRRNKKSSRNPQVSSEREESPQKAGGSSERERPSKMTNNEPKRVRKLKPISQQNPGQSMVKSKGEEQAEVEMTLAEVLQYEIVVYCKSAVKNMTASLLQKVEEKEKEENEILLIARENLQKINSKLLKQLEKDLAFMNKSLPKVGEKLRKSKKEGIVASFPGGDLRFESEYLINNKSPMFVATEDNEENALSKKSSRRKEGKRKPDRIKRKQRKSNEKKEQKNKSEKKQKSPYKGSNDSIKKILIDENEGDWGRKVSDRREAGSSRNYPKDQTSGRDKSGEAGKGRERGKTNKQKSADSKKYHLVYYPSEYQLNLEEDGDDLPKDKSRKSQIESGSIDDHKQKFSDLDVGQIKLEEKTNSVLTSGLKTGSLDVVKNTPNSRRKTVRIQDPLSKDSPTTRGKSHVWVKDERVRQLEKSAYKKLKDLKLRGSDGSIELSIDYGNLFSASRSITISDHTTSVNPNIKRTTSIHRKTGSNKSGKITSLQQIYQTPLSARNSISYHDHQEEELLKNMNIRQRISQFSSNSYRMQKEREKVKAESLENKTIFFRNRQLSDY